MLAVLGDKFKAEGYEYEFIGVTPEDDDEKLKSLFKGSFLVMRYNHMLRD